MARVLPRFKIIDGNLPVEEISDIIIDVNPDS